MKKALFLSSIGVMFLLVGCAEKPMATSVVELAGNQKIVGWNDYKVNKKEVKKVYFSPKPFKIKDSDKDGVPDNLDMCPNTPPNLIVDHNGCPIITTLRLNFDLNSAKVKKIYYPQIKKVAEILKANPSLRIKIAGYTDDIGSKEYNLKLSLKRAEAVKNILVKKYHLSPDRIVVKGYGEEYPLVPNTTPTNRALNRRVEIVNITNSIGYKYSNLKNRSANVSLRAILHKIENTNTNKNLNNQNKQKKVLMKSTKKLLKKDLNKKVSKVSNSNTSDTNFSKKSKSQIIIPPLF